MKIRNTLNMMIVFGGFLIGGLQLCTAQEDLILKKTIMDQYHLLQKSTQNNLLSPSIHHKKTKNVLSKGAAKKENVDLSVDQLKESFNQCKLSLKMVKAIMKKLKSDDPSVQSCRTLYQEAKSIKNQLQDLHFTPSGVDKLMRCQEIIQSIVMLLEKSNSMKVYLDQPDSLTFSSAKTLAKPLKGEKLPERYKKTQDERSGYGKSKGIEQTGELIVPVAIHQRSHSNYTSDRDLTGHE